MKEENKKYFVLMCDDWCIDYPTHNYININDEDYIGYEIQYRFNRSFYVSGINHIKDQKYKGILKEFGEVSPVELIRFIKWANNKIVSFSCITSNMDFINVLSNLLESVK